MSVWSIRWRLALRRRRLFAWNVLVPLLLLAPVAFSPAARPHRAAVFAVFFTFFGAFGTCIPTLRDGRSGWIDKVGATGIAPRRWIFERLGAELAIDLCQLLPTLAVFTAAAGSGPAEALRLTGGLALALAFASVLGLWIAALVRSLAEGALVCAAVSLIALHLSGVFRAPASGTLGWATATGSPLRPLHTALTEAPDPTLSWGLPLASATLIAGTVYFGAGWLMDRWSWPFQR